MVDQGKTTPDFGANFIDMQWRYFARFRDLDSIADAQIRNDEQGFDHYFFHTHTTGQVCHLEG